MCFDGRWCWDVRGGGGIQMYTELSIMQFYNYNQIISNHVNCRLTGQTGTCLSIRYLSTVYMSRMSN